MRFNAHHDPVMTAMKFRNVCSNVVAQLVIVQIHHHIVIMAVNQRVDMISSVHITCHAAGDVHNAGLRFGRGYMVIPGYLVHHDAGIGMRIKHHIFMIRHLQRISGVIV